MPEISYIEIKDKPTSQLSNQMELDESIEKNILKRIWNWLTKDKERIISLSFIFLFIVIIIILAIYGTNLGKVLSTIIDWFEDKIGKIGLFIGVFVISIFGNFTVIFPVPYTFALIAVATRPYINYLDILFMGICAGAGAAIGETSAWFFGKASKKVIEGGLERQVAQAQKWIDKGLAPLIIFIFAATPLPDDAVLILIGLLGYSLWKTIIWCFLGKIILTSSTGLIAKLFINTSFGGKILWLFGLSTENGEITIPDPKVWQSALIWLVSIILIGAVLFIDWSNIWNRFLSFLYKRKIMKLLTIPDDKIKNYKPEKENKKTPMHFEKENHYWQCSLFDDYKSYETKENFEKNLDYVGLLSVSYIVEKPIEIYTDKQWFNNLKFIKETNPSLLYEKENIWELEKPEYEKIYEIDVEEKNKDNLLDFKLFSIWLKDSRFKKDFNFNYLIQVGDKKINFISLGEKEALAIKLIKKYPREMILSKIIEYLEKIDNYKEIITKINLSNQIKSDDNSIVNNFKK